MFNGHQTLIRLKNRHLHMQWRKHRDRNRGRGIEERVERWENTRGKIWRHRKRQMEGGGKGKKKWSTDGERWGRRKREMERWRGYFSLSVLDSIYYTSTRVITHIQTLIFSLPLSLSFISLCLSFWLSSSVFSCIHLFICNLSLLSLSAAVLSALSCLCDEGVNDVALNIDCVLSTPSYVWARDT